MERREAIERVAHAELLGRDVHELKVASERELISDIWGEWGVAYGGNGYSRASEGALLNRRVKLTASEHSRHRPVERAADGIVELCHLVGWGRVGWGGVGWDRVG